MAEGHTSQSYNKNLGETSVASNSRSSSETVISKMKAQVNGELNGVANDDADIEHRANMAKLISLSTVDVDIIRLIGQHLKHLGLGKTVDALVKESGCVLDHPHAVQLRKHIMNGDWKLADQDLIHLRTLIKSPENLTEMKFLILEQKYLELLDCGLSIEALHVLQKEITPLGHTRSRVHELSSYLVCKGSAELHSKANWIGRGSATREILLSKLQDFLPPSVMVPVQRLRTLLDQAVEFQRKQCPYHDHTAGLSEQEYICLLSDHMCNKEQFPCETVQIITQHNDEVWFCKFSNTGKYLASGSKDGVVHVWTVKADMCVVEHYYTFNGHFSGIGYMAWSPDDTLLAVCGQEDCPEVRIWNVRNKEQQLIFNHIPENSLTSCAWLKCGTRFVAGGMRGQFYLCDLSGTVISEWEGVRVRDLQCLHNSTNMVLAADTHRRIRQYDLDHHTQNHMLSEEHEILSFTVNRAGTRALINVATQGLNLWDLNDKVLVRRYHGLLQQGLFHIFSSFGGCAEQFVASGSENNNVYVWHVERETPLAVLTGHTRTVSCVSWHPTNSGMLASCSDDGTIRIWGPGREAGSEPHVLNMSGATASGMHCESNGNTISDDDVSDP